MKTNPYKPPKHKGECQSKEYMDQKTLEWFTKYYMHIIIFEVIMIILCIGLMVAIGIGLLY